LNPIQINQSINLHTAVLHKVSYILWGDSISYYYPTLSLACLCAVEKPRHSVVLKTALLHFTRVILSQFIAWIGSVIWLR